MPAERARAQVMGGYVRRHYRIQKRVNFSRQAGCIAKPNALAFREDSTRLLVLASGQRPCRVWRRTKSRA